MSRAILTERFVSYSSKRQTEYSRQDQHLIELHGTNVDERERKKEREREREMTVNASVLGIKWPSCVETSRR